VPQRGSIVNCASVNSIQAMAGTGIYTASKHGVAGITKAVSAHPLFLLYICFVTVDGGKSTNVLTPTL
jgi:NAD(P)-dependent dehydrogenase (short-subunit alcohol dehydrogenase family)